MAVQERGEQRKAAESKPTFASEKTYEARIKTEPNRQQRQWDPNRQSVARAQKNGESNDWRQNHAQQLAERCVRKTDPLSSQLPPTAKAQKNVCPTVRGNEFVGQKALPVIALKMDDLQVPQKNDTLPLSN